MTNEDILKETLGTKWKPDAFTVIMNKALDLARADERDNKAAVPYQLCPKCNGQGQVTKPPHIAGDVYEWSSSSCIFTCDVCNGSKIIPMFQPTPHKQ